MIEPISTAVAKTAAEGLVKSADGLLVRVFGPAADELGIMLGDQARAWRMRNVANAVELADKLASASGAARVDVPLRIASSLLEGASYEDDADLQRRWAGLMASAATGVDETKRHPSFSRILSELTAREARMLDTVYKKDRVPWQPLRTALAEEFGVPEEAIRAAHGNIFRLGLWSNTNAPGSALEQRTNIVALSPFGRAFITATHGPVPASDSTVGAPL